MIAMTVGWRRMPFRLCAWWTEINGQRYWLCVGGDA